MPAKTKTATLKVQRLPLAKLKPHPKANVANLLKKVASGKTLTAQDRKLVDSAANPDDTDQPVGFNRVQGAFKPLRWTLEQAASEFPINPRTLAKRLKAMAILPGADKKLSTTQVCAAVFGDYEAHRARKMAADADAAEDEREVRRRRLMDGEQVLKAWEGIILPAKTRLQTIPSKVGSRLALTAAQQKVVAQEIDEALAELAKEPNYETDTKHEQRD